MGTSSAASNQPEKRSATVDKDQVLKLLELIQEIDEIDLKLLNERTRERIRSHEADIDTFLWKVALRETSDEKTAAATVERALAKLHDRVMWRLPGSPFRRWALGKTWRGQTARFWLYKEAKTTARTLKLKPQKLSLVRARPLPERARVPAEVFALMKGLSALHCSLKRSKRTRHEWREGDCTGGCDLLFLHREEFTYSEIHEGIELPRAVVFDYVTRCEKMEKDIAGDGPSGTGPPPGPGAQPPSSGGGHPGGGKSAQQEARVKRTAEAEGLIRRIVASYLTDEELQWRWERLCAARGALRKHSFLSSLRSFVGRLFSTERRNSSLLGLAVATAAVIMALVMVRPEELTLSAGPDSHRTGDVALPKNLRLDLKKRTIDLSEGNDLLSGTIEKSAVEPVAGVSTFSIALRGKDETGVEGRFQGTLWLTNAPGATVIRKKSHIAGARIAGVFTIVGRSTNAVEQIYSP